jgi:hypothetical protein
MEHDTQRRQRAHFFGKSGKEGCNGLFIQRSPAVFGQGVDDLLPICLIAAPLLCSLAQEVCSADHRSRRRGWTRCHLHFWLGPSPPTTASAPGGALATSTGSIWIFELVAPGFEPVSTTAGRTLIDTTTGIRAAGLGRSGAGRKRGTRSRAVPFK